MIASSAGSVRPGRAGVVELPDEHRGPAPRPCRPSCCSTRTPSTPRATRSPAGTSTGTPGATRATHRRASVRPQVHPARRPAVHLVRAARAVGSAAAQVALQDPRAAVPGDLVVHRGPCPARSTATSPAASSAPSPQPCRSEPASTTATTSTAAVRVPRRSPRPAPSRSSATRSSGPERAVVGREHDPLLEAGHGRPAADRSRRPAGARAGRRAREARSTPASRRRPSAQPPTTSER